MSRNLVTAEICRQYCEASQNLTEKQGIYTVKQMPKLPSFTMIMSVMQKRGLVEQVRMGKYKWIGPDNVTIVTGEALLRAYRDYESDRKSEKKTKANGKDKSPGTKPSRLQNIESRLAALEGGDITSMAARLDQIETALAAVMEELR